VPKGKKAPPLATVSVAALQSGQAWAGRNVYKTVKEQARINAKALLRGMGAPFNSWWLRLRVHRDVGRRVQVPGQHHLAQLGGVGDPAHGLADVIRRQPPGQHDRRLARHRRRALGAGGEFLPAVRAKRTDRRRSVAFAGRCF